MNLFSYALQDWGVNVGNTKGRFILLLYRLVRGICLLPFPFSILGRALSAFFRVVVGWGLGIELPSRGFVGSGLRLFHGQGLVVHDDVVIGDNVTLRHNTTIGASVDGGGVPVIGNEVNIGAGAIIVGQVVVGNNVVIGAGTVVVKSIPDNAVVVGNPARIVRIDRD